MENPLRGLPAPPPLGAAALPPGTYTGRVVLVTGGGTGLGKAIAAEFARLGADVVIAGRRAVQLDAACGELAAVAGAGRVAAAVCDIRDPERVSDVFDAAEAAFGPPDVLVNNAAANFPCPAEDLSPNAWRAVVDITLTGTWFMTREFARRHLAAGTPGSIVNIGASYAWTGGPGLRPQRRRQGRCEEPRGDAGRRVGSVRHPDQRPGPRAVPARGHDRGHPGRTGRRRSG
ncbi:SDR family NAD(P)-dependent oxidoreductase [Streptomyces sp. NBC_00291]|uniref:SDR family NAD(P)-dependent oxidoreductase n=1 Tax=Streptomyces sp. NBC_00291 TaxID=2975704 RepID=UPI00225023E5|nr:SDR family NAD(P)-dependent oxidoreductase [Streptomyces sp. NBC_00291]MCX5157228.1 SDR family NAD(P)-dependent oxidoreductase [Streptomyces sp. NBC_00291]